MRGPMTRFTLQLARHVVCPACGYPLATNPWWQRALGAPAEHHSRCPAEWRRLDSTPEQRLLQAVRES